VERQEVVNSGPMAVHGSARAAGSYTFVEERFSYDDQIDPQIVRDIQMFDPCYVPLRCRKVYRTPSGTVVTVDYHVIGRYIEHPTEGYRDAYLELEGAVPSRWQGRRKKIQALRVLQGRWPGPDDEGGPSWEWTVSAPPPVVRPGRWLVDQLAAVQKFFDVGIQLTAKDGQLLQTGTVSSTMDRLNQIVNAGREQDERVQREAMAEARYRMRHNWRQFKDALDHERLAPEQRERESKPFVDLGSTSEPLKGQGQ